MYPFESSDVEYEGERSHPRLLDSLELDAAEDRI